MEVGSILEFLENRSILVTGATGFLAKIFVEKILRVQPNVKKLYLLMRAPDSNSAMHRFDTEIISKDLFRVLKEKHGGNLNSLISQKIRVVAGDISLEDLGVKDSSLMEELIKEVDVVVNLAANTNFDERYDISIGINTMGAKHVLNFSKKCDNLKVLLHMSTAICNADPNAKPMRKKSWPMLEGWKEVFGKDRATGENAEDVMDAVNQLIHEKNLEDAKHANDDYIVDLEQNQQIDAGEDSACQSTLRAKAPREIQKKRKSDDGMKNVCELLTEIHRDTNARLETLAKKIGYQAELGKARKEVFDMLNQFPGLSLDEKFDACEILVDKPECLEFFMGLPEAPRLAYVARMVKPNLP